MERVSFFILKLDLRQLGERFDLSSHTRDLPTQIFIESVGKGKRRFFLIFFFFFFLIALGQTISNGSRVAVYDTFRLSSLSICRRLFNWKIYRFVAGA